MEDITRWREDMNFMSEWQEQYLRANVLSSLYYINILVTAFLTVFRRFPTTFQKFPKIFQNCPEGQTNVFENFRKLLKTFEEHPKMF